LVAAYAKNPTAIGWNKFEEHYYLILFGLYTLEINASVPIKKQAGKIQIISVRRPMAHAPLYPISVSTCVEDAPGSSWQNELYSINSCSVTS
jgi:hypothetical protein